MRPTPHYRYECGSCGVGLTEELKRWPDAGLPVPSPSRNVATAVRSWSPGEQERVPAAALDADLAIDSALRLDEAPQFLGGHLGDVDDSGRRVRSDRTVVAASCRRHRFYVIRR